MSSKRFVTAADFPGIPVTDNSDFMFKQGQLVLHVKSDGVYKILVLPDIGRLETTGEPAYLYQGLDGRVWPRGQIEMEDGRFVPYVPPEYKPTITVVNCLGCTIHHSDGRVEKYRPK